MSTNPRPASQTATDELAAFVSGIKFDEIPTAVVEHVKLCILDTLGCVVYGQRLPWTQALRSFAADETSSEKATIWGTDQRTSPGIAALVNGTSGHGFEIDDLLMSGLFHPGSVTIPAAMATAEAREGLDGRTFITAVVAGYEVGARVGAALGQPHFARGFHPQGTVGTVAAAASGAAASNATMDSTMSALAISASLGSGLMGAQTGGMTKRLHSGRASQNGVDSARLAQRGFTGTPGIFEADFGGFLSTLGGSWFDGALMTEGLGTEWRTLETGFKAYAACAPIHTSVDAAIDLRSSYSISSDQIASVVVHTTTHTQIHCGWSYEPTDVTNAQMNLSYSVARALIDGDLFVDQFTDEAIRDPVVVDLADRIVVKPREEFDALGTNKRHISEVELVLTDGSKVSRLVEQRTGSLQNPLTREQVVSKFRKLVRDTFDASRQDELVRMVDSLEDMDDCTDLTSALSVRER